MKHKWIAGLMAIFFASCSYSEKFPEPVTYEVAQNGMVVSSLSDTQTGNEGLQAGNGEETFPGSDKLAGFQQMYLQKDEQFDLDEFTGSWEEAKEKVSSTGLTFPENMQWFRITGFLFQLTAEARFAEELEKTAWECFSDQPKLFDSLVSPYIFTKNVDHIHVNLFLPNEISYHHSLGGAVTIEQEANLPESESVRINFSMEIKRYMEIFIRIPTWAEGTSVRVKGVKYFAQPGQYCIVAKKWKEGDVIEIEFPKGRIPGYLERDVQVRMVNF